MTRFVFAYVLSLVLALTGFTLAEARGANHDIGMDMVICTGVGMKVLTIGPDGQPVEKVELCPEGVSIFAAAFSLPDLPEPSVTLLTSLPVPVGSARIGREVVSPSARGPPALI
ncbi:MAG: hypothetical protein CR993_06375 [Rhodobacterales bacterium]|nr:MAG: hypothetical protein CR993_06375 [Rhodobacterales bacterium]